MTPAHRHDPENQRSLDFRSSAFRAAHHIAVQRKFQVKLSGVNRDSAALLIQINNAAFPGDPSLSRSGHASSQPGAKEVATKLPDGDFGIPPSEI
jgi:hypothetical protein